MTDAGPGDKAPVTAGAAPLKLFLIAGEASGDHLGAALMAAVRAQAPSACFAGIGGRAMAELGLASLFPLEELAINGFAAIPGRLPLILRRIRETVAAIMAARPDALVIIDSPDFTHRVARRVRAACPEIPILDYVSPTVWAWRPGRAAAMRAYVDRVLAVLPFEPETHRRLGGPPCTYVGHPLAEAAAKLQPAPQDKLRRQGAPPLLLVLPGSRRGEVRRHLATFGAAIQLVTERVGPAEIVIPTFPHLVDWIRRRTATWSVPPRLVLDHAEKWAAFRQARAAIAASGTVTLELALAHVPSVIAYKVGLAEEIIARALITTPMVGLANIILADRVMPELLQRQATAKALADAVVPLIGDTPERRRQCDAFARLEDIMEIGRGMPSRHAASIVIEIAGARRKSLGIGTTAGAALPVPLADSGY